MLWLRRAARPRPVVRTRLRLEWLSDRITPSGYDTDLGFGSGLAGSPVLVAPQIVDFVGVETGLGWYRFTGRVTSSATVGGLTVTLGGIPALEGKTATTLADGTFSLLVAVQTNGNDCGTASAQTTADGLASNIAYYEINPSS
ncbi:hypothetical protein [Urbifossiella limnaea]|uniref:Uncharacterized protein n=1 Tax=Urbifossiella limnaea TaxID=2528023 RepID=A0A517XZY5_9BACT|nr:hypothetical protein [Urbifossiella limnaea]QDU23075.1 hypothetical protein ETAA1_50660 [Urbifossiella limnaea]